MLPLEAHAASKEVSQLDKRLEKSEGHVGLDVIDIVAGGAVYRYNHDKGSLQITKRDQIVLVDGVKEYMQAKRRINNEGIVVRFAVMRGSGVTVDDLVPSKGKGQPRPSDNMPSPGWDSGCPHHSLFGRRLPWDNTLLLHGMCE